jgi:hypothetical protein
MSIQPILIIQLCQYIPSEIANTSPNSRLSQKKILSIG